MNTISIFISVLFVCSVLYTFYLFYKASNYHKPTLYIMLCWILLQVGVSLTGFYTNTEVMPPRFLLLVLPALIIILALSVLPRFKNYIHNFNTETLTLLHVVRIPVEIVLYGLYLHKVVPEIMTFEGRNFDILSGFTALLIFYFAYRKKGLSNKIIVWWNVLGLVLLFNIVVTAVLSAPFPFQQLAFDQPNIAVLYFPYILLPGFIVPLVLFSHIISLKKLIK